MLEICSFQIFWSLNLPLNDKITRYHEQESALHDKVTLLNAVQMNKEFAFERSYLKLHIQLQGRYLEN